MVLQVAKKASARAGAGHLADPDLAAKMLEAAPDAMIAVDHDGKIEVVNRQVEELFGYPRAEMLGQKIQLLLPTDSPTWPIGLDTKLPVDRPTRIVDGGPVAGRRKDCSEFPVEISLSRVEAAGGRLMVAAIRDITERRQVEEELRRIDERFRQLVESAPDGLLILEPEGTIQQANAEAETQFGYARAELIGKSVEQLLPERFCGLYAARRQDYLARPLARPTWLRLAGRRKDGTEFPIDMTLSPLDISEGRFGVARIRDVTDAMRMQRELGEKAALVDLAHDAILVINPADGRITYWNRGAETLYGYTAAEAMGHDRFQLLRGLTHAAFTEMVAKAAVSDHWDVRLSHTTKAGDELQVESRWAVLRDATGANTGILEINRDITARMKADAALRDANQLMEVRVQERTADLEAFSYSVSHDLRSPLRALTGFVDILVSELPDGLNSDASDALAEIRGNAVRMGQLIDDLLSFARLGNQGLRKREVDMTRLVRHTVDALKSTTRNRDIEVNVEPMPACQGDPALLEQVWSNLLTNAIKFTAGRSPAHITAGSELRKGQVVYFVRDDGVGFDMAHAGQLFGVFQRLHGADEFEGNGIGLANVMRISTRHGGTAWALAEPDRGATFYFTVEGNHP
ncbi:MAG TPA: PAS domain S-box protein [Candidatus Dormibacteraeota bacterium]|nr:PAS domain S-box protein [Candidatus Dormibacteraeota bacterium]